MPLVLVDTNLLLLMIVGRTDRSYLLSHKRTQDYDGIDADFIETVVAGYDGIVTTPHVLSETSGLLRQIRNPARDRIQRTFRDFILSCEERQLASAECCLHDEYIALGLTDAAILVACESSATLADAGRIELLTTDEPMYNRALSLGLPAELYA